MASKLSLAFAAAVFLSLQDCGTALNCYDCEYDTSKLESPDTDDQCLPENFDLSTWAQFSYTCEAEIIDPVCSVLSYTHDDGTLFAIYRGCMENSDCEDGFCMSDVSPGIDLCYSCCIDDLCNTEGALVGNVGHNGNTGNTGQSDANVVTSSILIIFSTLIGLQYTN